MLFPVCYLGGGVRGGYWGLEELLDNLVCFTNYRCGFFFPGMGACFFSSPVVRREGGRFLLMEMIVVVFTPDRSFPVRRINGRGLLINIISNLTFFLH